MGLFWPAPGLDNHPHQINLRGGNLIIAVIQTRQLNMVLAQSPECNILPGKRYNDARSSIQSCQNNIVPAEIDDAISNPSSKVSIAVDAENNRGCQFCFDFIPLLLQNLFVNQEIYEKNQTKYRYTPKYKLVVAIGVLPLVKKKEQNAKGHCASSR